MAGGRLIRAARLARSAGAALLAAMTVGAGVAASPPTSEPSGATTPTSSVDPPATITSAGLEGVLIAADVLDVPADWVITDLDPSLSAEQIAEFDPLLGLVSCAQGTLREGADRDWLSRRYSAPETPLENGLLSIELVVEAESDDEWEDDRRALDDCQTGEQALLTITDSDLELERSADESGVTPPSAVPMTTIELLASPTSTVPYPSAFNAAMIHVDDRTVFVILGGVDMGESYQPLVEAIAEIVLTSMQATATEP